MLDSETKRKTKRITKQQRDELITPLSVIESQLRFYSDHLHGKTVLLNANDPAETSAFWKYFSLKYNELGLSGLIATSFSSDPLLDAAFVWRTTSETKRNEDGMFDIEDVDAMELVGDGDFLSPECLMLLREADVVVAHPPASSFEMYVTEMAKYGVDYIVLGPPITAGSDQNVQQLIANGKLFIGVNDSGTNNTNRDMAFRLADSGEAVEVEAAWYTSFNLVEQYEKLVDPLFLYRDYLVGGKETGFGSNAGSNCTSAGHGEPYGSYKHVDGHDGIILVDDIADVPRNGGADLLFLMPANVLNDMRFARYFELVGLDVNTNRDHYGHPYTVDGVEVPERVVARLRAPKDGSREHCVAGFREGSLTPRQ